ncbi:MAG: hypothetical protein JWM31_2857, partial [Solirubrobacterales bacterium]|nr:hypothetical protein [Solirubrobacterales bacterium]
AGAAASAAPPELSPPAGTLAPAARKVERTAQLALRTSAGRLQKVADGVVRETQAAGGVVQTSTVDAAGAGGTADFTLSVPTARTDAVLARLSKLAHVSSLRQASTDITASFGSSAERLTDARAERRALLKALDAARTADGIARLKGRLRGNRNEIAALEAERDRLRARADTTSIALTLVARGPAATSPDGVGGGGRGPWTPRDAARDALRVLEVAAGVLLVALAVLLPLGLVGLPAWFGARSARRRRREHALHPV